MNSFKGFLILTARYYLHLALLVLLLLGQTRSIAGEEAHRQWDAAELFAAGMAEDVQLTADRGGIQLLPGVLLEDDGPAAGYSYLAQDLRLDDNVRVKKQFVLQRTAANAARLLVAPGGDLQAEINGQAVALQLEGKQGNYWQSYLVDPTCLQVGLNEIVLYGKGKVWIARSDEFAAGSTTRPEHPNRSLVSRDGGSSWADDHLGSPADANIDGEYLVRLHLDQFRPQGTLTLPVVDLGNLQEAEVAPAVDDVSEVAIRMVAETPPDTTLRCEVRTSPRPSLDAEGWSEWKALEGPDARLPRPSGRYLQVRFRWTTADPLFTPQLRELHVAATAKISNRWHERVAVEQTTNPRVVRSSIPFDYEPFDRPELAAFRKKYKLDAIVAGAESEFELIQRLASWSASQFERGHLGEIYPAWNALEILRSHSDGTPVGGFCQQYNLVFLQACESFGLVGRAVSIGSGNRLQRIRSGHEVVEIWSNEFQKWIYIDGNMGWYLKDPESEQPLSLIELRDRQLAAMDGTGPARPVQSVYLEKDPSERWEGITQWPPFVELRLIPRSNFLEQASPLPLNQGMRGWFWTGHYVWSDRQEDRRPLYSHFVTSRSDFQWTLNHVHVTLEATRQPGVLDAHFDLAMPHFHEYGVQSDGETVVPASADLRWTLHEGRNVLRIRPVNKAGRAGAETELVLLYSPSK